MKNRVILVSTLVFLLALGLCLAGCGGDSGSEQTKQTKSEESAAQTAGEAAPATDSPTVATHDCAGGCGMKDWPEDQLTEIDGKWYCAGCAKNVQAEAKEEGQGDS